MPSILKNTSKTKNTKTNQNEIWNVHKQITMESVLCWPSAAGQRACFGMWLIDTLSDTLLEQSDILCTSQYQLQKASWLKICVSYAFSVAGILSVVNLYSSCSFVTDFKSLFALFILYLKVPASFEASTTFGSYILFPLPCLERRSFS